MTAGERGRFLMREPVEGMFACRRSMIEVKKGTRSSGRTHPYLCSSSRAPRAESRIWGVLVCCCRRCRACRAWGSCGVVVPIREGLAGYCSHTLTEEAGCIADRCVNLRRYTAEAQVGLGLCWRAVLP